MKTLILEDSEERSMMLEKALYRQGYEVHVAPNVKKAQLMIEDIKDIDHLFLDHDLGDGPDGQDFAKWLVERNFTCKSIVIHSMNPAGAAAMEDILCQQANDVKCVPFNQLKSFLTKANVNFDREDSVYESFR